MRYARSSGRTERNSAAAEDRKPASSTDTPTLTLQGDFPGEAMVIPRALCTLLMSLGRLEEDGRRVLVPFIEMRLSGIRQGNLELEKGADQEFEQLFSRVLPLENLVWLLSDLTRDVRRECEQLLALSAGARSFETSRILQARAYAVDLSSEANSLAGLLAGLTPEAGATAQPSADEPASPRKKRRTKRVEV